MRPGSESPQGTPTRPDLAREQWRQFCRLVAAVAPSNPFYLERWRGARMPPPETPPAQRVVVDLAELLWTYPLLTKAEIAADQESRPPFGTNLTYPLPAYTRFSQTSGTSGRPLRWLDTPEAWQWMVDHWKTVLWHSGVTPADRVLFAFSFGPFLGFWTAFEAAALYGCLCLPGGGMGTDARLAVLSENAATVLCCTPTYALRLGEAAREREADTGSLRLILVAGEPGAAIPATRDRILDLWPSARLKDHHGLTEVGPVSYECPARPGVLHVLESGYIPEVLSPRSLEPVGPGDEGELVLTNLGRLGSPLVRYRTGDLVRRAGREPCDCGSWELALEGGILGRTDDMVVVRGVNVYPSALEAVLMRIPGLADYRAEITENRSMAELAITVEPTPGSSPEALSTRVAAELRTTLGLRVRVATAPPGALPRFELKSRRWVRTPAAAGDAE